MRNRFDTWTREQELMARLDNLEGCEDNPVYASEIRSIRKELAAIRQFWEDFCNDPMTAYNGF